MRKEIFGFLVLLLLIGGTYLLARGEEKRGSDYIPSTAGVIRVTGLVERPYNISYDELSNLPSIDVNATLYCVDNPNTPRKRGIWRGVPLGYLVEKARPENNTLKVAVFAGDGYSTDFYLKDVIEDRSIIVAYELNGKPITPRIVAPGRWGYKWLKEPVRIEITDENFLGTWERMGYPDDAVISSIKGKGGSSI